MNNICINKGINLDRKEKSYFVFVVLFISTILFIKKRSNIKSNILIEVLEIKMVNLCFIVMVSLYINVSGIKNTNKGH